MAVVTDPKKQKKKGTLLTGMNSKLGLEEGTTTLSPAMPTLRQRVNAPLGSGIPDAAAIGMAQHKAANDMGGGGAITGNGPQNGVARNSKRKKGEIFGNGGVGAGMGGVTGAYIK